MPKSVPMPSLKLGRLSKGYPCIPKHSGARLASAAAVCLEEQKHAVGVLIGVRGYCEVSFTLQWPEATDQERRRVG